MHILDDLSAKEKEVLVLRMGLDGGEEHTLENIGQRFGVTRERIRQIENNAIRRLRNPSRIRHLKALLE